mgnify:FL=1
MKKLLILLLLAVHIGASAGVSYCASAPVGYGKNATGGGNVSPTLVSTADELQKALTAKGQKVIIITKDITVSSHISISTSDKTLMALPGVKLISLQQNKANSGILDIKNSKNLILRNLTLVGPGAYDCDGWDLLCFDGVTNAWVDHCDFQDGCDGNFDNKGNTDNITVSWCRFRYLKKPKAGGSGGSADHRFSNLLGSSSSDKPADGTYNMTWAYCWWDEGCVERMLRCRNASLHFLNCYWNSSVAHYYIGPENADCYVEGCTFEGAPKSQKIFYQNYNGKNGVKFVKCNSKNGVPTGVSSRAVVIPSYTYTALTADASKTMITGNCGAGATLTVKTDGSVSSSCDSGETPTPDPEPEPNPEPEPDPDPTPEPSGDITWNFSDTQFANLGTISSTQTVDGLTIAATSDKTITIDASNKTYGENLKFTSRLKFGGTMGATYRYLCFAVKGSCTIEVYGMSGNSNTPRPIVLAKEQWDNTIHTWADVPGSELSKLTYQYVGGSTTLYIGSGNSGVNLYGINLIYDKETTLTPARSLNNGKTYNLLGMEVDENYKGIVIRDGKKYLQ